jgi:hypothetical protein
MTSIFHAQPAISRWRLSLRRLSLRRTAVKRQGSGYDGFFADPDAVESDYRRLAARASGGYASDL